MDNYYSRPEISNSDLSWLKNSLSISDEVMSPYLSYRFGTLVDAVITDPENFDFQNLAYGNYVYEREELDRALKMKSSFLKDEFCRKLIKASSTQTVKVGEVQLSYAGLLFSLLMRCKYDLLAESLGIGGDLKSTTAQTKEQFYNSIFHFDYDRQRAVYMSISGLDRDVVIGVSKVNFKVFKVYIKRGDDIFNSGMRKLEYLGYKYFMLFGDGR